MDLQELEFFKEKRELQTILEEFGNVRGANLLKEFIEEGFVDSNGKFFELSKAGKRKIGISSGNEQKSLKAFLSYSSSDYETAKQLKSFLEDFGIEVFLAHTSIEPTRQWEDEIYKSLKDCDMFIPLLTTHFKESRWTDQECGIAYNEGKKIIPIMIDLTPYGFLGKFQALRVNTSKWTWRNNDDRVELINLINREFPLMRECIINSLDKTSSWIIGKTKFKILKNKEPFSKEELNKIMLASKDNNQIYNAEGVKDYLAQLIEKYEKDIEPSLKDQILDKIQRDKTREILGGKSEAGLPILYGSTKEKLEQLKGYGGERIEQMREELMKELEEEKKLSLVDGFKSGL